MIVLYVLFAFSVFCPVYTYALYPIVLRFLKGKDYKSAEIEPSVSVVIVGEDAADKITNIQQCAYPEIEIIEGEYRDANRAKGEIIVFTDTKTEMDLTAISEIVKPFADERVGAVIGQQTNPDGNSAFWKYENLVKRLESRIGCVSGANKSLFAIRKRDMLDVPDDVLNKPFFIATKITENGKHVVFQESAKAYEGKTEGTNFQKHIEDAAGYWQALRLLPKMLLGRHGSFVYVSHRVMKWFVWLNMIVMLVTSGVLAVNDATNPIILMLLMCQILFYVLAIIYYKSGNKRMDKVTKILSIIEYFSTLNLSYIYGLVNYIKRR